MPDPNIIERLQEIDHLCDELRGANGAREPVEQSDEWASIETSISNIEGIVGEILTMIDGR